MNQSEVDGAVSDYLARLRRAARRLPSRVRRTLLADIEQHINEARAVMRADSEMGIHDVLHRIGPPAEVVSAATTRTRRKRFGRVPLMVILGALVLVASAVTTSAVAMAGDRKAPWQPILEAPPPCSPAPCVDAFGVTAYVQSFNPDAGSIPGYKLAELTVLFKLDLLGSSVPLVNPADWSLQNPKGGIWNLSSLYFQYRVTDGFTPPGLAGCANFLGAYDAIRIVTQDQPVGPLKLCFPYTADAQTGTHQWVLIDQTAADLDQGVMETGHITPEKPLDGVINQSVGGGCHQNFPFPNEKLKVPSTGTIYMWPMLDPCPTPLIGLVSSVK